jgi:hypothetical protein
MATSLSAAATAVLVLCGVFLFVVIVLFIFYWKRRSAQAAAAREGGADTAVMFDLEPPPGTYKADPVVLVKPDIVDPDIETIYVRVLAGSLKEVGYTKFSKDEPIELRVPGTYEFQVYGRTKAGTETPVEKFTYVIYGGLRFGVEPPPGQTYQAPLTITVDKLTLAQFFVSCPPTYPFIEQETGMFTLDVTGTHVLTLRPKFVDEHNAEFLQDIQLPYTVKPPAPLIIPGSGEITDATKIEIVPHCTNTTAVDTNIRYSVDDRYPTTPYIGSFFPPEMVYDMVPHLTVKAITVGRDGTHSDVVIARLAVHKSGCEIYDPTIPEPSCVVTVANPTLTFWHPRFTTKGGTVKSPSEGKPKEPQSGVAIKYQIQYRDGLSPPNEEQYTQGDAPVAISTDNVVSVTYWAVDIISRVESPRMVYTNANQDLPRSSAKNREGGGKAGDLDVSAVSEGKKGKRKKSKKGDDGDDGGESMMANVEPPQAIVNCTSASLKWDDPPRSDYRLRYTLRFGDVEECAPDHNPANEVDITAELAASNGALNIVARYFVYDPKQPGQPLYGGDRIRKGRKFSHAFEIGTQRSAAKVVKVREKETTTTVTIDRQPRNYGSPLTQATTVREMTTVLVDG